jgi:uncharacterized protein YfiM (DUF2279 family)
VIAAVALTLTLAVLQQGPRPATSPPADPAPRNQGQGQRDAWFGADKLKHFFVAAFTQSVAYSAFQAAHVRHDQALAGAWAVTAAASVAKEMHDRRTTGLFSVRDLVWDAAGAGTATGLISPLARFYIAQCSAPPRLAWSAYPFSKSALEVGASRLPPSA